MQQEPSPDSGAKDAARLRRHVRILVDLGRLAGETADLDHFFDLAVVQVARAVEIDHVKLLRYRRKTSDLLVAAGIGWKEGVVRAATLPADLRSPPGRAFQTAEPVLIADFAETRDMYLSALLREHGIVSLVNVPVMTDGAAWGVLEVDSTRPRDFSGDTVEFLTAAAALIGAVVYRGTLEQSEADRLAAIAVQARHQDVLLREMQHRVKNNFQLILASIAMQKRRFPTGEAGRALDHVANRISAISLAHDQLAPRRDGQIVDLAAYLRALCLSIEQQTDCVTVDVEADDLELTIDRAVPLGLVVNEAATNSVKHAFGGGRGRITVTLKGGIGYGEARLTVADDGRGSDSPAPGGSGLKLMAALARQIGGAIDQQSTPDGTTTTLTFPLIN